MARLNLLKSVIIYSVFNGVLVQGSVNEIIESKAKIMEKKQKQAVDDLEDDLFEADKQKSAIEETITTVRGNIVMLNHELKKCRSEKEKQEAMMKSTDNSTAKEATTEATTALPATTEDPEIIAEFIIAENTCYRELDLVSKNTRSLEISREKSVTRNNAYCGDIPILSCSNLLFEFQGYDTYQSAKSTIEENIRRIREDKNFLENRVNDKEKVTRDLEDTLAEATTNYEKANAEFKATLNELNEM
ncbi:unnamed protein product [Clavelina lepadiformis]|uniref:Tropomyosin n=1 Tax=Clavelina lepadiformis TaxID=159417 RepID=A0ABP0FT18_CLALP